MYREQNGRIVLNIHMSKFLELCEQFDPANNSNPKWDLVEFLKSKGIHVSAVRDTNMLYIDTGEGETAIAVEVVMPDEEEESERPDPLDSEVEKMANNQNSPNSPKAQAALRKRQVAKQKAVSAYDKETQKLDDEISKLNKQQTI